MIGRDVRTIVWREWREIKESLFSVRRGGAAAGILSLVLGIVAPIQMGRDWVTSALMEAYWAFLAASLVSTLITDSIAGERERHTLETVLASRLGDGAIFWGKILAVVLYGLGFALVNLLLGVIAVNIAHPDGGLALPDLRQFVVTIVLVALACTFVSAVGVFISLRAQSVKQAQQTFGIAIVVFIMGPALTFQAISPGSRLRILTTFASMERTTVERNAMLILAGLGLLALVAARARFRRGKLVLD
jgi:ABC-2 type transport system permease protein